MKIEQIDIEELIPYEHNAKIHTSLQIEQIKKSIQEFGNNDPIAIDENNVIIEGHGRYLALLQLGYKKVDVIRLTHMTDEEKRAYILVHNQLTLNTDFDFNILDSELSNIEFIDMDQFGFEIVDIDPFDFGEEFTLNDSETPLVRTMSMAFTPQQYDIWSAAIECMKIEGTPHESEKTNSDCNAIAEIVYQWSKERGLIED